MKLLNEIQQALNAPKNRYNKFGEYNYRNASDILAAVKPLLSEGTLVISNVMVQIGDRIYVEATAWLSDGSQTMKATAHAREDESRKKMNPEQLTGSASSYAKKYALEGLFALDDSKDADATNNGKSDEKADDKPGDIQEVNTKLYLEFTAEHPKSLPNGFEWQFDAFRTALRNEVKKKYPTQKSRIGFAWTTDNLTPFSKKIKPSDTWVQINAPSS